MIQSKKDLADFLEADKKALGRSGRPKFNDLIWKYEIALRYSEYYNNRRTNWGGHGLRLLFWKYRKYVLGIKCNFTIPLNAFEKGLSIAHIGPIIVNGAAHIGENCRIHVGVNIGTAAGTSGCAPQIGNNVYIGPGAKIFGPIHIADDIAIGANAVVNKDCLQQNVTLGGVPAKIISYKGSKGLI